MKGHEWDKNLSLSFQHVTIFISVTDSHYDFQLLKCDPSVLFVLSVTLEKDVLFAMLSTRWPLNTKIKAETSTLTVSHFTLLDLC